MSGPLLTLQLQELLQQAARKGVASVECSLDLERSRAPVAVSPAGWSWQGQSYPWIESCKERTIYWWDGGAFQPAQRYAGSLIKLVPTQWGTPSFEIDGIKMLVSENVSPWEDARRKVALIQPSGKVVLDTCGGLGYFAAHCSEQGAREVRSFEKNADVLWLRSLNPWSPATAPTHGDIVEEITRLPDASFDAALHDPPRFGIAGELYALSFYQQLFRVLRRKARLFHYTGAPNKLTSGRDVPGEVLKRLRAAGFAAERSGDGVLATKK